jgi:uncharacterized protein
MKNLKWQQIVEELSLSPHPEGGYYKEIMRDHTQGTLSGTGQNQNSFNSLVTHILFLLPSQEISCFHKLESIELWNFHLGAPIDIHQIIDGAIETVTLGTETTKNEKLFHAVPANKWFAAKSKGDFSLLGCTVIPGFQFSQFKMANSLELIEEFPHLSKIINRFTHQ